MKPPPLVTSWTEESTKGPGADSVSRPECFPTEINISFWQLINDWSFLALLIPGFPQVYKWWYTTTCFKIVFEHHSQNVIVEPNLTKYISHILNFPAKAQNAALNLSSRQKQARDQSNSVMVPYESPWELNTWKGMENLSHCEKEKTCHICCFLPNWSPLYRVSEHPRRTLLKIVL